MRAGLWVLALSGCVSIPPYQGATQDASPDVANKPLEARLIANAYRQGGDDGVGIIGSQGMSKVSWTIPTTGIVDGDLILFIANCDNGWENFWILPPGFTVLANNHFGTDGQSYAVGWKIASGEPAQYAETYRYTDRNGGSSTLSLVAVTGYDPQAPINTFATVEAGANTDPVPVNSPGVTTTVPNTLLIYTAAADWVYEYGLPTVTLPDGFTQLTSFGDENDRFDWSTQTIATKLQPSAGATGPIMGTLSAVNPGDSTMHLLGNGWTNVVAIAPAH